MMVVSQAPYNGGRDSNFSEIWTMTLLASPTKCTNRYFWVAAFFVVLCFPVFVFAAAPKPTVTNVSPNSGPPGGGTSVTITGTNFLATSTVTFGANAATGVASPNATTITCTTPANAAGAATVTVTT